MRDLMEWGKIVKGVNTTPDVGVNQIPIEAAKFGNTVDKYGRPPTLSSVVKGKSTNVLFNLGLTEGIKLKLERDKDIDVLHIWDTKEKNRVEVRGKRGYETNGYDPQDKLHQVLDRVGKAASVSDLMNGDVVDINPHHPQGARAIRTARDVLTTEDAPRYTAAEWAIIEGGHSLDDLDKPTPTIAQLVKKHGVPVKDLLAQLSTGIEHEYEHTSDFEVAKEIALDHIADDPKYYDKLATIDENFADGKKKGKSRPGRVKKSGASCNGSVTSLRKKAKAGGEKGRMYHWCANMKSGRKKK